MTTPVFIEAVTVFVLVYFVAMNLGYLVLNALSLASLWRGQQERVLDDLPQVYSGLDPAISLLVPAYNEEASIADSIRSMLQLNYANVEIVVINDGSKDGTLAVLQREFALEPFPQAMHERLATQPVRAVYRSRLHPTLRVIDKDNGGKADSLNAGINLASHELFCGVDADSILERDSLQKVVKPFQRDPRVVASGGTVRVANGCDIEGGFLTRVNLPRNLWALFQVVEYLRAFLFGRLGWSQLNAMLIISGAFGLFRKDVVIEVGGYKPKTIGEDMELVVRLHRHLRAQGRDYRIEFVPDPVCWTEAPEDMQTLRNQRIRWQRGLSESLVPHMGLMFNRRGGAPGWLAFPFMVVFEWLGPIVELGGYLFMAFAWAYGLVSWEAFAIFLFVAIGLGILLSVSGLLLEEMAFHLYPRLGQLGLLAGVIVLENLGYRQLNSWWRLVGLWRWATQREARWGEMKRKGLRSSA
jgi:cellulose synthase/poly-beta-1,6-N-acetylglucosamine synthase-like glycosyltransferase